jgi:hypothetical protein
MIDESWPWKDDLARTYTDLSARLSRYKAGKRTWPSETLFFRIERFAFLFAFITRKLLDSKKLSQEIESTAVKARAYPKRLRKRQPKPDEHFIMEKYSFSKHRIVTLSLRRLCDVLIHSKEFLVVCHDDKTFSLGFNSDKSSDVLYDTPLNRIIEVADDVSHDDVVYLHRNRDPKTEEWSDVIRSRKHRTTHP